MGGAAYSEYARGLDSEYSIPDSVELLAKMCMRMKAQLAVHVRWGLIQAMRLH